MNIIHVYTLFQDEFSGAKESKITTQSEHLFEKMKNGIGTTFKHFDKKQQITYLWKVLEVRRANVLDYKTIK